MQGCAAAEVPAARGSQEHYFCCSPPGSASCSLCPAHISAGQFLIARPSRGHHKTTVWFHFTPLEEQLSPSSLPPAALLLPAGGNTPVPQLALLGGVRLP